MSDRTPRNFDGTKSPAKQIGDLLPKMLADIGRRAGNEGESVFQFWFTLIGEKMAPMTECVSWEHGVLTVKVKSATLYSLLCQHEKSRLMKRLQEKFPIRNIVFRIG